MNLYEITQAFFYIGKLYGKSGDDEFDNKNINNVLMLMRRGVEAWNIEQKRFDLTESHIAGFEYASLNENKGE